MKLTLIPYFETTTTFLILRLAPSIGSSMKNRMATSVVSNRLKPDRDTLIATTKQKLNNKLHPRAAEILKCKNKKITNVAN
ncbi:hypothetical protein QE152_g34795 [Popillia japonica]|uniref:Uncharacterized protein n=1 Tax=Popillia japonica TaxID=7064 RepID=A0AAW1ISM9_POPJA